MTPPTADLRGLSVATAEKYGKPCVGAYYAGKGVRTNRLEDGACCCICGQRATNSHHEPPTGMAGGRALFTLKGRQLKPALFALCGSGTTGCHGKVHSGQYRIRWEWDSEADAAEWWQGWMPTPCYEGSPELYWHGEWVIETRDGTPIRRIRKEL